MRPMPLWEWAVTIALIGLGLLSFAVLAADVGSEGTVPMHVVGVLDSDQGFVAACYGDGGRYLYYDRGDQDWQRADLTVSCAGGAATIEVVLYGNPLYLPWVAR